MSVQTIGSPVQVRAPRTRLRLEHFVMGGAILCLIVLVVLPLLLAAARQRSRRSKA